jgi:uncharacterized protein (DUF342 family)
MFTKSQTEVELDTEIRALLRRLKETEKDSEEYKTLVEHVSKLHKLKCEESPRMKPISPDTVLVVAANIFGLLLITNYERENVITSKAFGNILKPR